MNNTDVILIRCLRYLERKSPQFIFEIAKDLNLPTWEVSKALYRAMEQGLLDDFNLTERGKKFLKQHRQTEFMSQGH